MDLLGMAVLVVVTGTALFFTREVVMAITHITADEILKQCVMPSHTRNK